MPGDEPEWIDAIVVAFDEQDRVLASPTSSVDSSLLSGLIGEEAIYEDYNGVAWRGTVVDVSGESVVIVFNPEAPYELPPGLGNGSLIRIPSKHRHGERQV